MCRAGLLCLVVPIQSQNASARFDLCPLRIAEPDKSSPLSTNGVRGNENARGLPPTSLPEADSGSFCRIRIDEYGAYQTSDDLARVEMRYHQMQRAETKPRLGWDFTS
jgi:hypothetical protein